MRRPNNDTLSRGLMNGKLDIIVRKPNGKYEVKVTYKGEPYLLPGSIDILFECLLDQLDGKYDVAKAVYEKIEKEVNEALARFQMREAQESVVQFQFPVPPTFVTHGYSFYGESLAEMCARRRAEEHAESIRNCIDDLTTNITMGATPVLTASDRYTPSMEYLTLEEFEERKERGELRSGNLYVVLN